ncbi:hypothetical protein YDYSY3_56450 [Paenibacillus chitinolyticus]|uniref:polysaccharide deacetylase family protein n=1 Tax=Paenibacillus chitinolyticus TaxID=79263 RepID=UPI0026E4F244|nr:polysaccharide deacetylase family protein [Paenibacillus chitinolyticus]GKS14645.1 hypothetical protein YDYSY3_56450 [Paenibacillus chitinolyticus]
MKKALKIFLSLLLVAGSIYLVRQSAPRFTYKDQVAVLLYHHISDTDTSNVTITPALFRSQLTFLKKENYHFITLQQFKSFMAGGNVPENAVLVTFDDGYESLYDQAYPVLKELQVPAVNFEITGTLADPRARKLHFLDERQLRTIATDRDANISCQCHSDSMHDKQNGKPLLTTNIVVDGKEETEEQYKKRVINDALDCKKKLKKAGEEEVDSYAYPYGYYDARATSLLQSVGYKYGFTVLSEMTTRADDPMQISRITAGSPDITPQVLNRTIQRNVMDFNQDYNYVPLRDTLKDLGGTMTRNKDHTITFYLHGKPYQLDPESGTIETAGKQIPLKHPLLLKSRKAYIHFKDLENVLGVQIAHNPLRNSFFERLTPAKTRNIETLTKS